MKRIAFLLFLGIYLPAAAQTAEDVFLDKICDCLTLATEKKNGLNEEVFENCWSADSALLEQLEDYLVKENLITDNYEAGHAFGKAFYEKNQVKLMMKCDGWFRYMDQMRYEIFENTDTSKQELKIRTYSEMLKEDHENPGLYIQRGVSYFILGKNDQAKKDFETACLIPGASPQCLYFLGWISEISFEFERAIAYYTKAREYSGITYFDTMIGIAERKKRDYLLNR